MGAMVAEASLVQFRRCGLESAPEAAFEPIKELEHWLRHYSVRVGEKVMVTRIKEVSCPADIDPKPSKPKSPIHLGGHNEGLVGAMGRARSGRA